MSDVTEILAAVRSGDVAATERLFERVYEELRSVAAQKMAREAAGQTLQPTALVHEAWLRLGADAQPHWQNRAHFFAAAAEAMRRILVDRARRKLALRRGEGAEHVELDDVEIVAPAIDDGQLLALSEALDRLA
ncbi:MAG: RNA polymerase subunit sigma, partial [Verrucomicrobiales bacterium]|nr:RNA polymerase subunit sigma [Verrucomicrobiales bacterium]